MVGLIALIFYWLGSYILLYLSRVREYAADAFSAKYTDANLLADALIKIAMGILSTPGDARLVKSTRYIGVA
ncbi:M48 family metalloprotease [Candidatus Peregrinibacteria bacterium]|nr:M48 family metalloprotease [Candidatus Peregrinibacteria bacterium]